MRDHQIQYLQTIQGIITRMSNYHVACKLLSVVLFVTIYMVLHNNPLTNRLWPTLIRLSPVVPLFFLWYLEAFYLRQDRLYRKLYDRVRLYDRVKVSEKPVTFSLVTKGLDGVQGIWRIMVSLFLSLFYVPMIGLLVTVV